MRRTNGSRPWRRSSRHTKSARRPPLLRAGRLRVHLLLDPRQRRVLLVVPRIRSNKRKAVGAADRSGRILPRSVQRDSVLPKSAKVAPSRARHLLWEAKRNVALLDLGLRLRHHHNFNVIEDQWGRDVHRLRPIRESTTRAHHQIIISKTDDRDKRPCFGRFWSILERR